MGNSQTCRTCRHWFYEEKADQRPDGPYYGQCRRYPPEPVFDTRHRSGIAEWVVTAADSGCRGEWVPGNTSVITEWVITDADNDWCGEWAAGEQRGSALDG